MGSNAKWHPRKQQCSSQKSLHGNQHKETGLDEELFYGKVRRFCRGNDDLCVIFLLYLLY